MMCLSWKPKSACPMMLPQPVCPSNWWLWLLVGGALLLAVGSGRNRKPSAPRMAIPVGRARRR